MAPLQDTDWFTPTIRMIGRLAHSPLARTKLEFFIAHFDDCVDDLGFVREGYAEMVAAWADRAYADWEYE